MKNSGCRASEGAGGFSLPNKANRLNSALAAGFLFDHQIYFVSILKTPRKPGLFC